MNTSSIIVPHDFQNRFYENAYFRKYNAKYDSSYFEAVREIASQLDTTLYLVMNINKPRDSDFTYTTNKKVIKTNMKACSAYLIDVYMSTDSGILKISDELLLRNSFDIVVKERHDRDGKITYTNATKKLNMIPRQLVKFYPETITKSSAIIPNTIPELYNIAGYQVWEISNDTMRTVPEAENPFTISLIKNENLTASMFGIEEVTYFPVSDIL